MKMKIPRLEDLALFIRIADCGGLSAAARELDITPAVASAGLKRLEDALGGRLFVRSTRSLRLTVEGERYLGYARNVLQMLEEGAANVAQVSAVIGGELNLSIPSDLGRNVLLSWLDDFQRQHPAVRLRIRISDRLADLYRQPVDIAVRYGEPEDSGMVALPLAAENRRVLCAASSYIERHGAPRTLEELKQHNCLRFVLGDQVHERWRFHRRGNVSEVIVQGDRVCDDGDLVRRWAIAGEGIAYKSSLDVAHDIRAGRLQPLLTAWQGEIAPLNLVCTHRLLLSPSVTALRAFLQQRLEAHAA